MRNSIRFVFVLTFLFSLVSSVYAQNPELPDYTGWKTNSVTGPVSINGQDATLKVDVVDNRDDVNLRWDILNVVHDPHGNLWLAVWIERIGERKSPGNITLKQENYYLFEYHNGSWFFVKDFSKSNHPQGWTAELHDFLADKYKLEFKNP